MARTWVDHEETKAVKWAVWNRTLMQDESELQQVWSMSGPCERQGSQHTGRQVGTGGRGRDDTVELGNLEWNLVSLFSPSLHLVITLKLITSSLSVADSVHSPSRRKRCWSPSPRATVPRGEGQMLLLRWVCINLSISPLLFALLLLHGCVL